MKIQKTDIDQLNTTLTIEIEKEDYLAKFNEEIKKIKGKAAIKGFRKGKTPIGFVKKMYGKGILADAVNESLQKGLYDYIKDQDLNVLGDPLPSKEQGMLDFDANDLKSYSFQFDLGLSPEIKVVGAESADSYTYYDIELTDKIVDEELEIARKRQGSQEEITTDIEEKDMLKIEAVELSNGTLKEAGHQTDFTIMVDLIADEALMKKVLTQKKGDSFDFDIYNLEKDKDETHVKKYLLNLGDDEEKEVGKDFRGKIEKVLRMKPAALDQKFFDGYFGPDKVKDEAEAKKMIKEEIGKYYTTQADSFMYREIMENLIETNKMDLPEPFLKRWLKATNDKLTEEQMDKEFPEFLKNLKWTLIRGEIAKKENVEVKPEEIQENIVKQVQQYFGPYGMDQEYINSTVQRMMQDRNQINKVYEELLSEKVFAIVGGRVTKNEKKIDLEEFKEKVKVMNEKLNK